MNDDGLTFQEVDHASYPTVVGWLHKPHVNAFFHGQGLENTLTDLGEQVGAGHPRCKHWIAAIEGDPFGYLITSHIDSEDKQERRFARHMDPGDTAITLDLLIGEEKYLGKGLAPLMIGAFLRKKFPHLTKVFIDPEVANPRAIHVYEKVGFQKLEQFIAEWHPVPHWLMMLDLSCP